MMWTLISVGFIVYSVIGAIYARTQSVTCLREARSAWCTTSIQDGSWRWRLFCRMYWWPYYALMSEVLTRPVYEQQERVKQLKKENLKLIDQGLASKDDDAYIDILMSLTRANDELIKQLEI